MDTTIIDSAYFGNHQVSEIYQGNILVWPVVTRPPEDYFTIKKLSGSGVIRCRTDKYGYQDSSLNVLYYWKNTVPNASRTNYTGVITAPSTTAGIDIAVTAGDVVMFWRKEKTRFCGTTHNVASFDELDNCAVYGNLASLCNWADTLDGGEPTTYQSVAGASFFNHLFYDTGVISAKDLVLPWNSLPYGTFYGMFNNCTNLVDQPALPATILGGDCYAHMYTNCTSLTQAIFPTNIIDIPWGGMPYRREEGQFREMYKYCTGLTSVIVPRYDSSVYSDYMFSNTFESCSNLTTAVVECPEDLEVNRMYMNLFRDCRSLNNITCLAKTISNNACLAWTEYVSSTGTFTKHPSASWSSGVNGIPSGWTIVNANTQ